MNRSSAVFLLFLRQSVWKLLLVLAAMAALEVAFFAALLPDPTTTCLEEALWLCHRPLYLSLLGGFAAVSILLLADGSGRGRMGYTLARLRCAPMTVVLCQALYNTLAYLLLWGVQTLVLFLLCWIYQARGGFLGAQTLFLVSYQDNLFHSCLPLSEWSRWLRNLFLAAGLGGSAACFCAQLRRQEKSAAIFLLLALTAVGFILPFGSGVVDGILIAAAVVITGIAWNNTRLLGKELSNETNETKQP